MIMALGIEPPDEQKHGHRLGVLTHVKFSYCMQHALQDFPSAYTVQRLFGFNIIIGDLDDL